MTSTPTPSTPDPKAQAKPEAKAAAKPTAPSTPKKAQPKTSRRIGRWIGGFVVLLLLAGFGAAGWLGWQQWLQWQDRAQQQQRMVSELQQQLSQQNSQITQLERALSQLNDGQRGLQQQVEGTQQNLLTLAQQVNTDSSLQESDVQRLEIEYLLRTARHLSQLTGDLAQAAALLQQADRLLVELNDIAYLPAREALAQDLQALRNTPSPDIDGIYFELRALEQSARLWQWWPQASQRSDSSASVDDDTALDTPWYLRMAQELRGLVTVRYRGDLAQARLTPDEFNQMQAQFRMLLQQAQVAALQRNQLLYDSSLAQAQEWLFDAGGQVPNLTGLLSQLDQLRAERIELTVPEINRALTVLRQFTTDADTAGDDE